MRLLLNNRPGTGLTRARRDSRIGPHCLMRATLRTLLRVLVGILVGASLFLSIGLLFTTEAQAQAGQQAGDRPAERLLAGETIQPPRQGAAPAALRGTSGPAHLDRRLLEAVRQGQENGGRYPIVSQGLSERVPFGYQKPTLHCQPLRSSLIRLEPGETVWAAIPADPVSWSVQLSQSGPGGITPIVVVKPLTEESVLTNLFITTDRRIYEVLLESGNEEASQQLASTRRSSILEFYYPEDIIQNFQTNDPRRGPRVTRAREQATTRSPTDLNGGIPLDEMRFTYEWEKDEEFPWEPKSIFDDGAHVYITLPADARHEAGAVLFVRGLNGENTLLEYAIREGRIITDRVFREAQFIYSEPSKRKKPRKYVLTIKNTAR